MKVLQGNDFAEASWFMRQAAKVAERATCKRAKCGTVIVKNGTVIGKGNNHPPGSDERNRKCHVVSSMAPNPRHDQTCCVHAEWEAIFDTLRHHPHNIKDSTLYFTRVDEAGEIKLSGMPYCTVCSRLALAAGIRFFVLWHKDGITVYDTEEYNDLSYEYERPAK